MDEPQLIGVNGMAARWGISIRRVNMLVDKPDFPEPEPVEGGGVRVWGIVKVDAWRADQTARFS